MTRHASLFTLTNASTNKDETSQDSESLYWFILSVSLMSWSVLPHT